MSTYSIVEQGGRLWLLSESGVESLDLLSGRRQPIQDLLKIRCLITRKQDGQLWCGAGSGLFSLQDEQWQPLKVLGQGPGTGVRLLAEDSRGQVWCAANLKLGRLSTSAEGALEWRYIYGAGDGLPGAQITCLFVDKEDRLWCATNQGLSRFHPLSDEFVPDRTMLDQVYALTENSDGILLAATASGLFRASAGSWQPVMLPITIEVHVLMADRRGRVWCGGAGGLLVLADGDWVVIDFLSTGEHGVLCLYEDSGGHIWCGTEQGLFAIENYEAIAPEQFLRALQIPPEVADTQILITKPEVPESPPPPAPLKRSLHIRLIPQSALLLAGQSETFLVGITRENIATYLQFDAVFSRPGPVATFSASTHFSTEMEVRVPESQPHGKYKVTVTAYASEGLTASCSGTVQVGAVRLPDRSLNVSGGKVGLQSAGSKSRLGAAILAILLGWLGVHKFYLGRNVTGWLYLLFFWTGIPGVLGLLDGFLLLVQSDEKFNRKYNQLSGSNVP